MQLDLRIRMNSSLYLRDPEMTDLGQNIIRHSIELIYDLGFEHFTFKKLAETIGTTEASIYRYFENKHRLLLYFLTWYWNFLEFSVVTSLQNMHDPSQKIKKVIDILSTTLPDWADTAGMDKTALHSIAIAESSKAYLVKEVDDINQEKLFKPYKDLCGRIANLFLEHNPAYKYPRALASTLVEMAQFQPYFAAHLPALTDFGRQPPEGAGVVGFLESLVFSALK